MTIEATHHGSPRTVPKPPGTAAEAICQIRPSHAEHVNNAVFFIRHIDFARRLIHRDRGLWKPCAGVSHACPPRRALTHDLTHIRTRPIEHINHAVRRIRDIRITSRAIRRRPPPNPAASTNRQDSQATPQSPYQRHRQHPYPGQRHTYHRSPHRPPHCPHQARGQTRRSRRQNAIRRIKRAPPHAGLPQPRTRPRTCASPSRRAINPSSALENDRQGSTKPPRAHSARQQTENQAYRS